LSELKLVLIFAAFSEFGLQNLDSKWQYLQNIPNKRVTVALNAGVPMLLSLRETKGITPRSR
jgi:hypothetical protein